eukprot:GILK01003144.1.p1 GENE.GILK01003144.1~~GILK01003144.1.p1  ORF type:complete len:258 (+),score=24.05 GILK01003144.1:77-850(+)
MKRADEPHMLGNSFDWRRASAELFATTIFVFVTCGTIVTGGSLTYKEPTAGRLAGVALASGLIYAALQYALLGFARDIGTAREAGWIVGHMNPAVTFALALIAPKTRINPSRAALYITMQIGGAIFGALLVSGLIPDARSRDLGATLLGEDVSWSKAFTMELLLSFMFVFFSLLVYNRSRHDQIAFAPLLSGLCLSVMTFVALPISGASFNPARSFAPALVAGQWDTHWIFWVAPLMGTSFAAIIYSFLTPIRKSVD